MRRSGVVPSVEGLGRHDHACLPFADDGDLIGAIDAYLTEGRRLGQRLMYVGSGPVEKLRADLAGLANADRLLADDVLLVSSLADVYAPGVPIDPVAQLEVYAAATEQALKEGFTGLRVAAEVTALVTEPATWDAHLRWESYADRYMARMPLSAMCCYDTRKLPRSIIGDLSSVHPVACGARMAPFRLYAGEERNTLMLDGEVDFFSADALDRLLELAAASDAPTVLDLRNLGFIEQHGLTCLARHAHGSVSFRNVPTPARRLGDLIEVGI